MRTSKKTLILDAATRVVQDSGVTAVTFDSVAAEAGLTRGGIMYHFPSRDDLLAALHEHQAQAWDEAMTRSAGKTAEEATDDERLAAYVRVCADTATRAEPPAPARGGEHTRVHVALDRRHGPVDTTDRTRCDRPDRPGNRLTARRTPGRRRSVDARSPLQPTPTTSSADRDRRASSLSPSHTSKNPPESSTPLPHQP